MQNMWSHVNGRLQEKTSSAMVYQNTSMNYYNKNKKIESMFLRPASFDPSQEPHGEHTPELPTQEGLSVYLHTIFGVSLRFLSLYSYAEVAATMGHSGSHD